MISPASAAPRRAVAILAACHGLGISAAVVSVTISALAATSIGLTGAWATVPYGIQFSAALLTTLPASLAMQRFGRKPVFLVSAGCGIASGIVGALAIGLEGFGLLCAAHALLGINLANVNFYRFAALDVAPRAHQASAMSLVLFGGTFAALIGPLVTRGSEAVLPGTAFQAAYLGISVLSMLILSALCLVVLPAGSGRSSPARRGSGLRAGLSEPRVMLGLAAGALGYGAMNLLMVGCSIAMSAHGMAFSAISYAIQLHVLAMYLPSLVMGRLIERFGPLRIVTLGAILVALAAVAAIELSHERGFFVSLVLLGLGWNAMYVGGSSIVAAGAGDAGKFRLQGINDLGVGIAAMVGAFLPGAMIAGVGWHGMNWLVLGLAAAFAVAASLVATQAGGASLARKARP